MLRWIAGEVESTCPVTAFTRTHCDFCHNFRVADNPPEISVSLQVEHKQFIGNGHLIGSSLR